MRQSKLNVKSNKKICFFSAFMIILCGGVWGGAYLSLSSLKKMDWNASFIEQDFPVSFLFFLFFAYCCYLMFITFKASYYTVEFNARTFTYNFLFNKTYDYANVKEILMMHMSLKNGGISNVIKVKINFYTVIRLSLYQLSYEDKDYIINNLEYYTNKHYKETELSMWHM